ncbi:MAG: hypothetical protein LBD09_00030 [Treponema sp.]|jgi:hypothetical protein|nr:hypothetical protein [Treponema sp.]
MSDIYAFRERTITALKFRATALFFFLVISVFSIFVITSVMQVNTVIRFISGQIAVPTVRLVQRIIDGDAFRRLSISLDEEDPFYEATRRALFDIKSRAGCAYLYTMAPVDETTYRFIIDGSAMPGERNFSTLGTIEDVSDYEAVFFDIMESKEIIVGSLEQNERWGDLVSAYGPIFNSAGEIVGLIGCDLEAAPITTWIRRQVLWQVGIISVFILLGLAVYLLLIRKIGGIYREES